MAIVEIDAQNLEEEVLRASDIVLLDFWAEQCGPCRALSAVLEEIAAENLPGLKIGKINIDNEPDLAQRFGVMSIPTLIIVKGGVTAAFSTGLQSRNSILKMIRKTR